VQNEKIVIARIRKLLDAVKAKVHPQSIPLTAEFIVHPDAPIPYDQALAADYRPIAVDEVWGRTWACGWFRFTGAVPVEFAGCEVVAVIDFDGEGCVFRDGTPWIGLSGRLEWYAESAKARVPLYDPAEGGEDVSLLVEAGANTLFGEGLRDYKLKIAELVVFDREMFGLEYDCRTLFSLTEILPERSPRRQKLLRGLNDIANAWNGGNGLKACRTIAADVLDRPANASAPNAWSIGHAHIDLAWLWPIRETRRKGGRTFATALRLMERYPEYQFGASQPQLYQWIREDYPALYEQIRARIAGGRWECQGGSWVEMDVNLTGGESLVRQILYGTRFFREEFGKEVDYLFLPDCFGFSAALPQILRKSGLTRFLTQKMSWSESNPFPHHSFWWEGIDGSRVLTHFLPTNDYNGSNTPKQLVEAEQRHAQNDVSDDFMNLYGIGDGGGGPSAEHIELALRQRDLEGSPRVKPGFVKDFLDRLGELPADRLPVWADELYLELHRGTYTTQAKTKRWNRKLEHALHDLEFLAAVFGDDVRAELDRLWKDTLLHQFHDILPGSSIGWVYREAEALSEANFHRIEALIDGILTKTVGKPDETGRFVVVNPSGTSRWELLRLPVAIGDLVLSANGAELAAARRDDVLECLVELPGCSFTMLTVENRGLEIRKIPAEPNVLENDLLRVEFAPDGSIARIHDRETGREWLDGPANRLELWEDEPNKWGAWDVNHFYRETTPETARLVCADTLPDNGLTSVRRQTLAIGNSTLEQRIELVRGSRMIRIDCRVDWRERRKMLRAAATPSVQAREAAYEIQFGLVRRPTRPNTSWDAAKFECVGHRFVDLSRPDAGFALLNDCKYGHSVIGSRMEINLLRAPADVDPDADLGVHEFTFAYLPHEGDLAASDVFDRAHALNAPSIVHPAKGALRDRCLFAAPDLKIDTVKPAEDGIGWILRIYEPLGRCVKTILSADRSWSRLVETDLMERPLGVEFPQGAAAELRFQPFEIRTFRYLPGTE
jgi:alpha-mannosidase